ncbi:hypothetical protein B0H11DRAFT_2026403 [Mycena galericulata]|nr:hypothetical protein B0H11DRAFT_2026403 [Mycena galericulata]
MAAPSDTQILLVHAIEDERMASAKTEGASDEILVPGELVLYDADGDSGDDMSIHADGPESLSNSALTQADTDATAIDDVEHPDEPDADPYASRRSRVRFRSRVRIASGLHHHRHSRRLSATSSLTSSRSSSVSAPLRSPTTEETCTPGWGTLGTRVALLAYSSRQAAAAKQNQRQKVRGRRGVADIADGPSEATALLGAGAPPAYDDDDDAYFSSSDDEGGEVVLSRQIDAVFGKWPGRLLNRHWWWWQLQPVICCGCFDESDPETP